MAAFLHLVGVGDYDATGCPYERKDKQIPVDARIIEIADSFDAINSSRIYRVRIVPKKIMQELQDGRIASSIPNCWTASCLSRRKPASG